MPGELARIAGIKMAHLWRVLDMRIKKKGTSFHDTVGLLIWLISVLWPSHCTITIGSLCFLSLIYCVYLEISF